MGQFRPEVDPGRAKIGNGGPLLQRPEGYSNKPNA